MASAAVVALTLPAAADHTRIVDLCLGVDHPPFDITPPGGGNSYIIGNGRTDPALPNAVIEIVITGPEAPDPFQVETDGDGWVDGFAAAIQTHGTYPVLLANGDHEIGGAVLEVGPEDVPCPAPRPVPAPADGLADDDPLRWLAALISGRDLADIPDAHELFWGGGGMFFPDLLGDHIYSDPRYPAGAPRGSTDILEAGATLLDLSSHALLGGALDCGPQELWDVVCPPGAADSGPFLTGGSFFLTAFRTAEPVARPSSPPGSVEGLHEYAVVYDSNGDPSDDWMTQGPYAWDGFQGTDRWYVARGEPAFGTWDLDVVDAVGQAPVDSGARVILIDDAAVFMVPTGELDAPTGWRGYAFNHDGSYRPAHSAMDVTGGEPTEPLQPMPTVTFASDVPEAAVTPSPDPAATPSPTEEILVTDEVAAVGPVEDGGDGPSWPIVALGGLVALGGASLLLRRDGLPGAVATTTDPCADELTTLDDARSRCEEARAEATAVGERLAAADADVAAARTALAEARAELPGAGGRDRDSWIESDGRRIDSGDVAAGAEADAAAWARYQAGEITAEEVMEHWRRRGTPEEVERLRNADAHARQLEGHLAAAEAGQEQATADAEAADAAASAACAGADAAAARLERCREAVEAEAASSTVVGTSSGPAPAPTDTGTTVTTPPPTAPVTTAGGDDPRDADEEQPDACCDSGMWVVYGRSTTSFGVIVGRELINLTAVCVDDPSRWIEFEVMVIRIGFGAQIGAGGLGGLVWGAKHPRDVFDIYVNQAGGAGFDLDLGTSVVKLLKSGKQLKKSGKLWDALKKLPGEPVPPPRLPAGDLAAVKEAAAEAAKEFGAGAGGAAATSAAGQGVKGSLGDLIVLPLGLGAGVALHYGKVERSQVVAMSGCRRCRRRGRP